MAALVNNGRSARDVWTVKGWHHVAIGGVLECDLDDGQVLELLELGFNEVDETSPRRGRPPKTDGEE